MTQSTMKPLTIHTAKTTFAARPRSPYHRAKLVREASQRDGWAYATQISGPGVRVVVESACFVPVGDTHMDLDIWGEAESRL